MYAVIKTGGKQYRVQEGDLLCVDKMEGQPGDDVSLDSVLLIGEDDQIKVGEDVAEAKVAAVIARQDKSKKIIVFKKRRRKNYVHKQGHRQSFTALRIGEISVTGAGSSRVVETKTVAKE
ncbi:MAG: 50S ribosomal protein L21 [Mariprofundaceae bacterium]